MLYLKSADGALRIIILETENLEELRKGRPAKTPDGEVLIGWCPDPDWLTERLKASDGDPALIFAAIDEASKRPQAKLRPHHGTIETRFTDTKTSEGE